MVKVRRRLTRRFTPRFKIVWHGKIPKVAKDETLKDVAALVWDGFTPRDFIVHTVFLPRPPGPGSHVIVWTRRASPYFHAEYHQR